MADKQVEVLECQTVYSGFYQLQRYVLRHTLYKGGWSQPLTRELFRRTNCVAVLLYDPDQDAVVLIEQFRMGPLPAAGSKWLVEIVAGAIEEGETALEVAHRESQEEAGCVISDLLEIMQFYTTPGGSSERITLFCGRVDSQTLGGLHGLHEEGEDIQVSVVAADTAFSMLERGEIESGIPIIALQWLALHRDQLRQQWLGTTL